MIERLGPLELFFGRPVVRTAVCIRRPFSTDVGHLDAYVGHNARLNLDAVLFGVGSFAGIVLVCKEKREVDDDNLKMVKRRER